MDVVHLPPNPWLGPQSDSDQIRDLGPGGSTSLSSASNPWVSIERMHATCPQCEGPVCRADLRVPRQHEIPVIHDPVRPGVTRGRYLSTRSAKVFQRSARWPNPLALVALLLVRQSFDSREFLSLQKFQRGSATGRNVRDFVSHVCRFDRCH